MKIIIYTKSEIKKNIDDPSIHTLDTPGQFPVAMSGSVNGLLGVFETRRKAQEAIYQNKHHHGIITEQQMLEGISNIGK